MNTSKYEYGYLFKDCIVNRELLPSIPFIKNKKIGNTFEEKQKYRQEFEAHKVNYARQIKIYFEKSIKCRCGKPSTIQAESPFDIELGIKPVELFYSCKNKKCLQKLNETLQNRWLDT